MTLVAARAYGLDVIDGVYNDFKDDAGFRAECEHGRTLGMDGKTLIHPSQVMPCNEVFSPTEDEVSWAQKIIKSFEQPENARKGVITVEGRMVERLASRHGATRRGHRQRHQYPLARQKSLGSSREAHKACLMQADKYGHTKFARVR